MIAVLIFTLSTGIFVGVSISEVSKGNLTSCQSNTEKGE